MDVFHCIFIAVYPNSTLPNIKECCLRNGVEMKCVTKMCDVENPPTSAGAFNLAFDCRKEFTKVTPCLAGIIFFFIFGEKRVTAKF